MLSCRFQGCGASPLIDWEDLTLRPTFYPPWLPWLDPDAKPVGFEVLIAVSLAFIIVNIDIEKVP